MSGEKNIYDYITTEGKRTGKKFTALDYFQKSTGVFNDQGVLSADEVIAMKQRAQNGSKCLWHGFVSVDEDNSHQIDNISKCIHLVKRTFNEFIRDIGFDPKNIDLMCALHLDKPTHLHIHFLFWEKAPKQKYRKRQTEYRHKGKFPQEAIDKMHERLDRYLDNYEAVHITRAEALHQLKQLSAFGMLEKHAKESALKEMKALARELPTGQLFYNSKSLDPYRERIDKVVKLLLNYDSKANKADLNFHLALRSSQNKAGKFYGLDKDKHRLSLGNFDNDIKPNPQALAYIETVEQDYRRRQGNIILKQLVSLQSKSFREKPNVKHRVNDNYLKKRIAITDSMVSRSLDKFMSSFSELFQDAATDSTNRLRQIENEIAAENEEQKQNTSRYNYGKG